MTNQKDHTTANHSRNASSQMWVLHIPNQKHFLKRKHKSIKRQTDALEHPVTPRWLNAAPIDVTQSQSHDKRLIERFKAISNQLLHRKC